jgi:ATP/maltotriose-dependent transcriptional regulator MalT
VLAKWPDPTQPWWADAAATVATCRNLLGRHDEAIELATAGLAHVGASPFAPASLRRVIAQASRARGDSASARDWFAAGADAAADHGVHGIAMELRVDHALLVAELGNGDAALELVDGVIEEARQRSAAINLAWAMGGRGAILVAAGDDRALAEFQEAVAYSRSIGYPAGVSFSLRMLAQVHLDRGDRRAAAATLLELLAALLERGGLNDLRMVLDHAARVLAEVGDDRWVDVAATARALPVTTVGSAVRSDVFDRAGDRGDVLELREAYTLCRDRLTTIAGGVTS